MEMKDLQTEVAVLKKDINQFGVLFSKLDVTIEKIGEVSNNISRLLAVHEERLDTLNSMDKDLERKLTKQRDDFTDEVKELHSRITTTNREMLDAIHQVENNIKLHIDAEHIRQDKELREIEKKVTGLERYKWVILGGAIVFGYFVNKIVPVLLQ